MAKHDYKLPFFKFDVEAWLTGNIRFLEPTEQAVFINLCALIWQNNGDYEVDDFTHRHCNTSQQVFNECLGVLNKGGFVLDCDGKLSVAFLCEQIDAVHIDRSKKSKAGKKSAEARANNEQVSTNKKEERRKKKGESRKKKEYTPQFEELWRIYGLKGSKAKAFQQWQNLTEEERDQSAEAIKPYHAEQPDPQYRKDFERYLKDKVFEAVLERKEAGVQPTQSTQRDPECGNTTNHMDIDRSSQAYKDALARLNKGVAK